jgi:hypothetical protein
MKEFLKKTIARLQAEIADLNKRADASQSVEEINAFGEQKRNLKVELEEAQAQLEKIEKEERAKKDEVPADAKLVNGNVVGAFGMRAAAVDHDSVEFRTAFMNYVLKNQPIPAEMREDANTKTTDVASVIPTVIVNRIVEKITSCGMILPEVTRTAFAAGVVVPTSSTKPSASWVNEGAGSDRQKKTTGSVTFSHFKVLKKTPTKDDGPRLMRYTLYAGTLKSYVDDETVFCGNYKSKHHAKSIFEVVCSQDEVHTTQQFRNYCNAIAIDRGYNIRSCYLCQLFGPDKRGKEYDDDVPFNPDRPVGCRRDIDAQGLIECKPEEAMTCEQFKLKDRPLDRLKAQYAHINRYIWFKNADGSVSEEYQERKDYWGYRDFDEF